MERDQRNLLVVSYIKRQWMPYIQERPEAVDRDYYEVLRRFKRIELPALRGLFDEAGRLQCAAAVYFDQRPVFLQLLLTAPWRHKGAGSTLLKRIVDESGILRSRQGSIELMAAPGAVTFYQKFGFVIVRPPQKPGWDTPMRLTVDRQ
jgi:GNAT superfamily N-acetyltransferase